MDDSHWPAGTDAFYPLKLRADAHTAALQLRLAADYQRLGAHGPLSPTVCNLYARPDISLLPKAVGHCQPVPLLPPLNTHPPDSNEKYSS